MKRTVWVAGLVGLALQAQAQVPMRDLLGRWDALHARCAQIDDDVGIRRWNEDLLSLESDVRIALEAEPSSRLAALLAKESRAEPEAGFVSLLVFRWGVYLPRDFPGGQRYGQCPTEAVRVFHELDQLGDYGDGTLDRAALARHTGAYRECLARAYRREPDQLEPRIRQHLGCLNRFADSPTASGKAGQP